VSAWAFEVRTPAAQSLDNLNSRMSSEKPSTTHFFTVDVEEHFQVQALESVVSREDWLLQPSRVGRSTDAILESLQRHGVRGTFFVLGWLARHRPEVVRSIARAGQEIASHGFSHRRVTQLSPTAFREEVRSSKCALEDLTGDMVVGYRAPSFSIVPGLEWAFDVLVEEGYSYDSSLFPIRRPGYGYASAPRAPYLMRRPAGSLAEFPLATTNFFRIPVPAAGGGYLRQLPLGVIRRAFREAGERGESATFYIHPWEIDADQPRLPVSPITYLRHYRGLSGTMNKLETLLAEFRFGSIGSALPRFLGTGQTLHTVGVA